MKKQKQTKQNKKKLAAGYCKQPQAVIEKHICRVTSIYNQTFIKK